MSLAARLPVGRSGQALAVALLLVVAAAVWGAVAQPLLGWYAERADALERRTILARRMAQVAADLPRLQRQSAAGAQTRSREIMVFQGGSDAVAGAALQQTLQDMAASSGLSLSSIEALPPQQLAGYRQVGVRVAVDGSWAALVALLQAIDEGAPQMLVDDLQIRGSFGVVREADRKLNASLAVMGFRAGTAGP